METLNKIREEMKSYPCFDFALVIAIILMAFSSDVKFASISAIIIALILTDTYNTVHSPYGCRK